MTESHLSIQSVTAGYGSHPVIHDISIDVQAGETHGLIGLNGAGKTTLLKTVLGLKDQISGTILVDGHESGSTQAKKSLTFLPERFDPAWFLSAYEFIDFTMSLYAHKVDRAEVNDLANRVGLNVSYLGKRAQSYSKGMRQKLGLMAMFLAPCNLIILDEPMSGLDPLARAQIKDLMAQAKKQNKTIFLSSHILSDMEELCDRVSVLHGGRIVFTGRPSEMLSQTNEVYLERAFLRLIEIPMAKAA